MKTIKLPSADAYKYPYKGYSKGSNDFYRELTASKLSRKRLRAKLLQQQDFKCAYCLCSLKGKRMNVEHVVAIKQGGGNTKDNLVAACWMCNKSKGNKKLNKQQREDLESNLKKLKTVSRREWVYKKTLAINYTKSQDNHIRSIMNEV